MNWRDDLSFKGDQAALDNFVDRLTNTRGDWQRDVSIDVAAKLVNRPPPHGLRFAYRPTGDGVEARLVLAPRSAVELAVTSIYPTGRGGAPLTTAEANALLARFAAQAADPARETGVVVVGPGIRPIDLTRYTSPAAAILAEEYLAANGPDLRTDDDRKKWRAFAIRAYHDDELPDQDVLLAWLAQRQVSAPAAEALVDEYRHALAVLGEYEAVAHP